MIAVEFQTEIQNIIAAIPPEYRQKLLATSSSTVRVLVLAAEQEEGQTSNHISSSSFLQQLFEDPLQLPDFQPMSREEIYDRS